MCEVGTVSKISDCQPEGPGFKPRPGRGLNFRRPSFATKTSFEKNCFSAWASTLNMGLINKVDMVCLSPVGYGV